MSRGLPNAEELNAILHGNQGGPSNQAGHDELPSEARLQAEARSVHFQQEIESRENNGVALGMSHGEPQNNANQITHDMVTESNLNLVEPPPHDLTYSTSEASALAAAIESYETARQGPSDPKLVLDENIVYQRPQGRWGYIFTEKNAGGTNEMFLLICTDFGMGAQSMVQVCRNIRSNDLVVRKASRSRVRKYFGDQGSREIRIVNHLDASPRPPGWEPKMYRISAHGDTDAGIVNERATRWYRQSFWHFCNGGSLEDLLAQYQCNKMGPFKQIPTAIVAKFTVDILETLEWMYNLDGDNKVVHCDIHTGNIFVHFRPGIFLPDFYLADFGFARVASEGQAEGENQRERDIHGIIESLCTLTEGMTDVLRRLFALRSRVSGPGRACGALPGLDFSTAINTARETLNQELASMSPSTVQSHVQLVNGRLQRMEQRLVAPLTSNTVSEALRITKLPGPWRLVDMTDPNEWRIFPRLFHRPNFHGFEEKTDFDDVNSGKTCSVVFS